MSTGEKEPNAPSPDRFMERDVTDLRVTVGRFDEKIRGIQDTMVTKEHLAKSRLETARWALTILVPVLAAALGALAILFSNIATTAFTP